MNYTEERRRSNARKLKPTPAQQPKKSQEEIKAERKAYSANYRKENKEKKKAYDIAYREKNKEIIKGKKKKYREENKEKIIASRLIHGPIYRAKSKEKIAQYGAIYYAKNKEKRVEYGVIYRANNKEKIKNADYKRRALKAKTGGSLSKGITAKLMYLQKGKCAVCKTSVKKKGHHLDHIMPIALGGSNTDDNIQILCPTCNLQKGAKHPQVFMQSRGFLL
ncbi:MAG: HNH endonuclease [Methylobacter sp.]